MPFFRREVDIEPLGTGVGQDALKGLQERNIGNLLEIFKAATPVLEEMAKIKPETWRSMTGLFTALENTFGTTVQKLGQGFLTPRNVLQRRLLNTLEGFLAPVMVELNNIANQNEAFALKNQTGAMIGSTIGLIGYYWGPTAGALLSIAGGVLGSVIEDMLTNTSGIAGIGETGLYSGFARQYAEDKGLIIGEQISASEGPLPPPIWILNKPLPERRGVVRKFLDNEWE